MHRLDENSITLQSKLLISSAMHRHLTVKERDYTIAVIEYFQSEVRTLRAARDQMESVLKISASQPVFAHDFSKMLQQDLVSVFTLERGWLGDGKGAVLSDHLRNILQDFLQALANNNITEPGITPTPDGGVDFQWGDVKKQLAIGTLYPDNRIYICNIQIANADKTIALNNAAAMTEVLAFLRSIPGLIKTI